MSFNEEIKYQNTGFVCTYNYGSSTPERILENHCHPSYEIITVLSGSASYVSEGSYQKVTAGNIIIIPPMLYHSISSKNPHKYERITVQFHDSAIPRSIRNVFDSINKSILINADTSLNNLSGNLKKYLLEQSDIYSDLINALLVQLLYFVSDGDYIYTDKQSADDNLMRIIEFINSNLEKKLTLESISENVFLSVSTVSHIFKEKMNTSVKQYILQKKLAYAANLIKNGYSAIEASKAIGYTNYANFYTVYKKIVGETPSFSKKND